jgi:prophage antirepressor-like protein
VRGDDGEPWFRASDVCGVLGFSNPWQALESHVDEDDLQKLEATLYQHLNHCFSSYLTSQSACGILHLRLGC